jgi:hypothetical protein
MMSEVSLRDRARLHLRDGSIPNEVPRRVYGGPGVGARCQVCALPIRQDQSELELQFFRDAVEKPHLDVFHLHTRCFAAWELERRQG